MAGMQFRLLDTKETNEMFKNDEVFQTLLQKGEVSPQAIELIYGGTANAAFTEIGTAMTAEFKGGAFEKTTVLCKTRVLTLGGSYFLFYVSNSSGVITTYYAWFSKYQVQTVQTLAAASITTGSYFTIADSQAVPTKYYVWMDKNGDGSTDDPGPVAGYTGAAVNISAATTADDVATAIAGVLNALAGFGASAATDTVTITHATKGDPSEDAADFDTGFTITKVESGGTDPGVSGTGAECDIKASTTADDVGGVVAGVINALSDVACTNSSGTITITNAEIFLVTAVTDGASPKATGFTITQIEQSANAHSGAPLYVSSGSGDDIDNIAKDTRKVTIIAFAKTAAGVPYLTKEEVAMAGATPVKTAILKWIRLLHNGGSDWGTAGSDAKGQIDVENVDSTAFLVYAAGTNESEGGVIWVPNHFHCLIAEWKLTLHDITMATAGDGVIVRVAKSGFDATKNNRLYNTDPDNPYIAISATRENPDPPKVKWPTKAELHGTDVAKLTFQEAAINNATDFIFKAYVILWHKHNTEQD
jgi:hypothetical protein